MGWEVCFELLTECDKSCIHCSSNYEKKGIVDYDDFRRVITGAPISVLELSGGEPLIHPNIDHILTYSAQNVPRVILYSNSDKLGDYLDDLKSQGIGLYISILGDEETHNKLSCSDSYNYLKQVYDAALEKRVNIKVHYPLMRQNIGCVENVKKDFDNLKYLRVMRHGRAHTNWDKISISEEVMNGFGGGGHLSLPGCSGGFCNAGISKLLISPFLDVYPCVSLKRTGLKLGNLENNSLSEVMSSERAKKWRRMKSFYVLEPAGSVRLANNQCWGYYLHDGFRNPFSINKLSKDFLGDELYEYAASYKGDKTKVYVCGAHGVGKTTLKQGLSDDYGFYFLRTDGEKNPFVNNVFERQKWRIRKYKRDEVRAEQSRKEIVVLDRSPVDWLVYTNTFKKLGWLDNNEFDELMNLYTSLFSGVYVPENMIFLNPDKKWSKERIRERGMSKWMEHDMQYYEVLREEYDDFFGFLPKVSNVECLTTNNIEERLESSLGFIERNAFIP